MSELTVPVCLVLRGTVPDSAGRNAHSSSVSWTWPATRCTAPDGSRTSARGAVPTRLSRRPVRCQETSIRLALVLATTQRSAEWVGLDVRANPLRDTLVRDGFALDESGRMLAPRGPGLVGDLDHERVAALQIATADRSAP